MFEHLIALLGLGYSQLSAAPALVGHPIPAVERVDDRRYVSLPEVGVSLVLSAQDRVETVHLYGVEMDGFSRYRGALPNGLAWAMSRDEVQQAWGSPSERGEAQNIPGLGQYPAWDAFQRNGVRIHLQYKLEGTGISLITLSNASPM